MELAKADQLYKDAMETVSASGDGDLAHELLEFFIEIKEQVCAVACHVYARVITTCGGAIHLVMRGACIFCARAVGIVPWSPCKRALLQCPSPSGSCCILRAEQAPCSLHGRMPCPSRAPLPFLCRAPVCRSALQPACTHATTCCGLTTCWSSHGATSLWTCPSPTSSR